MIVKKGDHTHSHRGQCDSLENGSHSHTGESMIVEKVDHTGDSMIVEKVDCTH